MKNLLLVCFLVFGCGGELVTDPCTFSTTEDCILHSDEVCQDCVYYKSCFAFEEGCQKELVCDLGIPPPCLQCYEQQTYSCQ